MAAQTKRATIYFDPDLHKSLRLETTRYLADCGAPGCTACAITLEERNGTKPNRSARGCPQGIPPHA